MREAIAQIRFEKWYDKDTLQEHVHRAFYGGKNRWNTQWQTVRQGRNPTRDDRARNGGIRPYSKVSEAYRARCGRNKVFQACGVEVR